MKWVITCDLLDSAANHPLIGLIFETSAQHSGIENKAWLYPAKQYAIYAEVALACLSAWIAASKAKFWK